MSLCPLIKDKKLIELFCANLHPEMDVIVHEIDEIQRSSSGEY